MMRTALVIVMLLLGIVQSYAGAAFLMKIYGASTGGGAVSNPCAGLGNQLDYSQAAGCNLVQMMTGRP